MAHRKTESQGSGMGVGILALVLLISLWQYILALLVICGLVFLVVYIVADSKKRSTAPRPVQTRPDPKPRKPRPVREPPAPEYLPRWTASRRLDASHEHAQWQKNFDNAAQ